METVKTPTRTAEDIARENDLFRSRTPGIAGRILFTQGVSEFLAEIGDQVQNRELLLQVVGAFNGFSQVNNPYRERDFGAVECFGQRFYFKIDYAHPIDGYYMDPYEQVPYRVMTIMFTDEY